VLAVTGTLAKWNATELELVSQFVGDKPFLLKLGYQQETNALEWIELSYDSDAIPAAVEILRDGIVVLEEGRLAHLKLTDYKEDANEEPPPAMPPKKRSASVETDRAIRRRLVLE
jgi:hypothetical protein